MSRYILTALAATLAAGALYAGLSAGATQSPYEQAKALNSRLGAIEAEVKTAHAEATALEAALKPPAETPKEQTIWAPASTVQMPLSDAQAAARVIHRPEQRAENATANSYVPTDAELQSFKTVTNGSGQTVVQYNRLMAYVTGRPGLSSPSTDDLIQWACDKWGIPVELCRAQMVKESYWRGYALGDREGPLSEACYLEHPAVARISGTKEVWASLAISQVKWRCKNTTGTGSEPLRHESTAFALEYYAATVRYFWDGLCGWCGSSYGPGLEGPSVGGWFSPWNTSGSQQYFKEVQAIEAEKPWTKSGF